MNVKSDFLSAWRAGKPGSRRFLEQSFTWRKSVIRCIGNLETQRVTVVLHGFLDTRNTWDFPPCLTRVPGVYGISMMTGGSTIFRKTSYSTYIALTQFQDLPMSQNVPQQFLLRRRMQPKHLRPCESEMGGHQPVKRHCLPLW